MRKQLNGKELFELEKQLHEYNGEDKIISSHELAQQLSAVDNATFKVKTGIPTLDRILDDVESGELIIVTGPTGSGKTTLLMSVTSNMAKNNVNTAWFTLEVTPRQFINKISKSGEVPLFYVPQKNIDNTFEWIEKRIIEAKVKYDVKVVFIDHIHMIFSLDRMRGTNLSLEIGDLVAKIKDMAIQYSLTIFLIAHMKDDPMGTAREPKISDIRDSGMISRLADTVLGVWRVPNDETIDNNKIKALEEHDTKSKVRIFKNRREGKQSAFFMIHKDHNLVEVDTTYSEKYLEKKRVDEEFENLSF